MDSVVVKRIAKKVAVNSFWLVSDLFFLILKIIGTALLISIVACVIYACFCLSYIKDNVIADLEINPSDFTLARSSEICYIDQYGREVQSVIIQSPEYRRWVDYSEMPQHLIDAVVAIEDHRFYSHQGVDWYRTAGAFVNMFLGMRNTFGGSTITQQLIKNLTREDDVTVQRKLQEIFQALEYERRYGKEEILELYLNLVYFGHGCYGIGAAAHYYFDKDVSELTLPEAAAIVSITNNPSLYSPYADRAANKERQETVLWTMNRRGYFRSETEYRRALNTQLHFQRGANEVGEQIIYSWFEEAVMRDAINEMVTQLGYSEQLAYRMLYSGGLKIISTIDPKMQAVVDEIYNNPDSLPEVTGSSQQVQSGIVIADPYTGEIKALSGGVGRKTRNLLLNRATSTRRQPGSSIKPISAYAPAMNMGMLTPDTIYDDTEVELSGTTWLPRNANRKPAGEVTVREAVRSSINTIAAMVVDQLTPRTSYRFVKDMLGVGLDPSDEDYAPLALGGMTVGVTVREMASAYTMFPNGGTRLELRTFSMIYDYNGDPLLDNSISRSTDAISEVTAYWMTDMLCDVVIAGTGGSANLRPHMPSAGKTGTTDDDFDRWFVGFTPYYVAAVWTGYDTPADMDASGNPAAQIWKMVMEPIHEELETKEFRMPLNIYLPPVKSPWELDIVEYSVRCFDEDGNLIYEIIEESTVGAEVTVDAPELIGYKVTGQPFGAVEITADPRRNIIMFIYEEDDGDDDDDDDYYDDYNYDDGGNTGNVFDGVFGGGSNDVSGGTGSGNDGGSSTGGGGGTGGGNDGGGGGSSTGGGGGSTGGGNDGGGGGSSTGGGGTGGGNDGGGGGTDGGGSTGGGNDDDTNDDSSNDDTGTGP